MLHQSAALLAASVQLVAPPMQGHVIGFVPFMAV
jgi:hypothetical protein